MKNVFSQKEKEISKKNATVLLRKSLKLIFGLITGKL